MKKMVKCPLCGRLHQTRGKHYFRCCQMAWEVERCQVTSYDEARYTTRTRRHVGKIPDDEIIITD